ncbi:Rv3235 family protein [Microbacterium marinilacus]|uniref:3-hydroxyacyl-CoA dehydrogenase n=1 Tax=Microbacterium marinilacus TaxID=415209 RepID=A0ABP7BA79_9MICO|nr:Rv3235 family protein [Microbacterium marinilacus]MBY0687248.1 3-hydroxyacyl-CoA dehydrogenase [Microbacterium marinilacus]
MSQPPSAAPSDGRPLRTLADVEEHFAPQHAPTASLPDPEPLLTALTRGVLEVLAGVREPEQLARWLTDEPYRSLVTRAALAVRARSARRAPAMRPVYALRSIRHSSPADGVVEAVVVVETPQRTRAVALRLEGIDRRWRATSLSVL